VKAWLGRLLRGGRRSSTPSTVSARVSGRPLPARRVSTPEECAAGWAPVTARPPRPGIGQFRESPVLLRRAAEYLGA
jgi:hypothetical protein